MSDFLQTQLARMRASKQVRYGGYAILSSIGAVVALVLVNLIADQLQLQADVTESGLFTLGEQSLQLLDELESDVTIYQVAPAGRENLEHRAVLERYARRSRLVTVTTMDAERNPALANRYEDEGQRARNGSLVVESGSRFRVIPPTDLIDYSQQFRQRTGLKIEQAVTSALLYVTTGDLPTIYTLEGHGEAPLFELGSPQAGVNLRDLLELENYTLESVDLVTEAAVPADADLLLILAPEQDLDADELERILAYLDAGGRMVFVKLPFIAPPPNFGRLLERYGVAAPEGVIFGGPREAHPLDPAIIAATPGLHDIAFPFRREGTPPVVRAVSPLDVLEQRRSTLQIEPLLTTSDAAFLRTDPRLGAREQQEDEAAGPFTLAAAIQDNELDGTLKSRMVVFSSIGFLAGANEQSNYDLFINSLNWANEREDAISIRAKSTFSFPLRISRTASLLIAGVAVILLPLLALGAGTIVWLRRRHL